VTGAAAPDPSPKTVKGQVCEVECLRNLPIRAHDDNKPSPDIPVQGHAGDIHEAVFSPDGAAVIPDAYVGMATLPADGFVPVSDFTQDTYGRTMFRLMVCTRIVRRSVVGE
jgi:hypothetical protein